MQSAEIEARASFWSKRTVPKKSGSERTGLRWYWQLVAICAGMALIFSRQPDALLHAQFFAEDGKFWFADAYNLGWFTSLLRPQDGYFQSLPRLAAALSLLVPLAAAPLVMNIVGLFVQILPVPLLLSSRFSGWGTLGFRAMLALTYLAMPNCSELNVTIEEGQWHLALVACLLLLCSPPPNRMWKVFDTAVFIVCGLTGPFAILLVPIAALRLWLRPERFVRWPLAIICTATVIQAYALLSTPREHWPLGASLEGLVRIVAGQVFLGTILGSNGLATHNIMLLLVCVALAGLLLIAYSFPNAGYEWKLFLLFSVMVFVASLCNPFTPDLHAGSSSWDLLAEAPGIRYWFFPTLAFTWTIVMYVFGRPLQPASRSIGLTLILLMLTGFIRDWRIPPRKDTHFATYAERFNASAPGTVMIIPLNPDGWTMRLVKR